MADVWAFDPPIDSVDTYADGTQVPHRRQIVRLNDVPVGEIELHCHRRYGPDARIDVSYGATAIVYGPPSGGK